jgi:hypothetical protein
MKRWIEGIDARWPLAVAVAAVVLCAVLPLAAMAESPIDGVPVASPGAMRVLGCFGCC